MLLVIEEEERRQERRLLFGSRPSPSALFNPYQQCPHMRSAAVTLVLGSFLLASMNGLGLGFLVSICISFDYTSYACQEHDSCDKPCEKSSHWWESHWTHFYFWKQTEHAPYCLFTLFREDKALDVNHFLLFLHLFVYCLKRYWVFTKATPLRKKRWLWRERQLMKNSVTPYWIIAVVASEIHFPNCLWHRSECGLNGAAKKPFLVGPWENDHAVPHSKCFYLLYSQLTFSRRSESSL
jgi:hypothetical protein